MPKSKHRKEHKAKVQAKRKRAEEATKLQQHKVSNLIKKYERLQSSAALEHAKAINNETATDKLYSALSGKQ